MFFFSLFVFRQNMPYLYILFCTTFFFFTYQSILGIFCISESARISYCVDSKISMPLNYIDLCLTQCFYCGSLVVYTKALSLIQADWTVSSWNSVRLMALKSSAWSNTWHVCPHIIGQSKLHLFWSSTGIDTYDSPIGRGIMVGELRITGE